ELLSQMAQFGNLGDDSTIRWKDVPLEAALEMPNAYDLFRHILHIEAASSDDVLNTFVRVVSLHQRHNNMIDVTRGEPIVRLLVEEVNELWRQDDENFNLVSEWLSSALLEGLTAGNPTRAVLREQLLDHWRSYHPPAPPTVSPAEPANDLVANVV